MTPLAVFLQELCQSRQILKKELAYQIDLDPSYLSAIVNGRKSVPVDPLIKKIEKNFLLSCSEREALYKAAHQSRRRYQIPLSIAPQEYVLVSELMEKLGELRPGQIKAISEVLKL